MSTLNGGPGNIVTNGLVLYLDAANYLSYTSGSTTWRDLSSSNNSGSLVNGPTFSSGNGGSIVFDGVNDYVVVDSTVYDLNKGTLSIWFKRAGATYIIIGSYGGSGNQRTPTFYQTGNNIGWEFGSLTGKNTGISFTDDTWFNMVMTFDSSYNVNVYVNGTLAGTGTSSNPGGFFNQFTIGRYGNYGSFFGKGNFATTQVYNRALSAQEVLQNYNAQKTRFGL